MWKKTDNYCFSNCPPINSLCREGKSIFCLREEEVFELDLYFYKATHSETNIFAEERENGTKRDESKLNVDQFT